MVFKRKLLSSSVALAIAGYAAPLMAEEEMGAQNATMEERQDGVLDRENILGEIKSSFHEQSTVLQSNQTGIYSLISQQ